MTLPKPPHYVVVPIDAIDQAFVPDKPKRALLGSFVRILSLAWEAKYAQTPPLDEDELMAFLKLSRRQYFEQKAEMEMLGWLRSSHPRPGFVRFSFSRSMAEQVIVSDGGAENLKLSAEKRTDPPLKRIEEEESLKLKIKESSSSSPEKQVRKTALTFEKKMQALIENLHLLFDPEVYGLLEMREVFLAGIPELALGWIAKAYQDRERLVMGGGAIGLIVKHVIKQDAPHRYFLNNYSSILTEAYLEAVDEIEYECDRCEERFGTRKEKDEHLQVKHPFRCLECEMWFLNHDELTTHWEETHDPYRVKKTELLARPVLDGSIETAWQAVLSEIQLEMPAASFDTWVRDTQVVRYHGNALSIGARNAYAQDWLASRLTGKVERLLNGILDKQVTVQFVVSKAEVES